MSFQIGDKVAHPMYGAGVLESVVQKKVGGVVQEYYGSICVGQTDLVTVTGVERNAFGAVVMQVKGEIAQSPWQFVAIVLAVLLGIFLLLLIWSTWVRRRNRKRRQNRRKGNSIGSNLPGMYPVRPV